LVPINQCKLEKLPEDVRYDIPTLFLLKFFPLNRLNGVFVLNKILSTFDTISPLIILGP
jgi:hypothetical protein